MNERDGSPRSPHWLGRYGERVAGSWLKAKGCRVLATNYRAPGGGEVDIIARDGKLLLFIEVKTRRAGSRVRPLDAVNRDKQSLIERGANAWLKRLGTRKLPWRFDILEVRVTDGEKPQVTHIRNAF